MRAFVSGGRGGERLEGLEHAREVVWLQAGAAVAHFRVNEATARPHADFHDAFGGGEFEGVGDEVVQNLAQAGGVGQDLRKGIGVGGGHEGDALVFGLGQRAVVVHRITGGGEEVDRAALELDAAGLDGGGVEELAHQAAHVGGVGADVACEVHHRRGLGRALLDA